MKFGDLSYFFENQNLKPAFHPFNGKSHQCGIGKINVLESNKLNTQMGEHIRDWFVVKEDS